MPSCEHCSGSGVLNVIGWQVLEEMAMGASLRNEPYASACHACKAGAMWAEIDASFNEKTPGA